MFRRIIIAAALCAAASPAGAQVISAQDSANRPAAGEVVWFAGAEYREEHISIEMLSADARPGSGSPNAVGPFNHTHGNRGLEFDVNHSLLGVRFGALTGFYDSSFTSVSLTLGGMDTALTQRSDANTYAPQGRFSTRLTAGFGLRLDLQAWFQQDQQHFFARVRYRFGASWTYFDDDFFLSSNVDGVYHESSHRITIDAGYDSGPFKPYIGVGTLWYRGGGEVKESDFARGTVKNSWRIVFRQSIPFSVNFGVDLPALDGAFAQVEFAFIGEASVGFSLGGRF